MLQIGLGDQLLERAAPHRATELEFKRDAATTFQSLR
jgi:hypothetical protein